MEAAWAIGIFLVTYAFIVSEKIHRTIVAMLGALIVVGAGIVEQHNAVEHIDFNTLGLLIGMMVIVHITAETGVFSYAAVKAAKLAKGEPVRILIALAIITAVGSAFLDNVTTILLIVPVTFSITRQLKVSPIPYLITQIIASNIGGTATLIGDPPNIMIGSAVKQLTFLAFIENLAPIVVILLLIFVPIFMLMFRKQLRTTPELKAKLMEMDESGLLRDRKLMIKSLSVLGLYDYWLLPASGGAFGVRNRGACRSLSAPAAHGRAYAGEVSRRCGVANDVLLHRFVRPGGRASGYRRHQQSG